MELAVLSLTRQNFSPGTIVPPQSTTVSSLEPVDFHKMNLNDGAVNEFSGKVTGQLPPCQDSNGRWYLWEDRSGVRSKTYKCQFQKVFLSNTHLGS